ncbi:MAG: TonB-dependent receptor domain-containing protein [Bryobacteraceae bacterium]
MSRSVLLCGAALLLGAGMARGQEVRAVITGLVTDPSGAPVASAAVSATNRATNTATSTTTNEAGSFVTPFLQPGEYELAVEAAGFKKFLRQNIILQSQDKLRVDVQLQVGDLTQSVTVSEQVTMLQTESASRAQIISNELIANVPTQGRNLFQIAWAAPGVVKTGTWRYLRSFDIGGTSGLSVNGGRNKENEVLLDGISNVQADRTVIHVPTIESVQEFKVQTNTYDAQYGRTGGGIVTIVTKAGGNNFHGNLFEYFQNSRLNANQSEMNRGGIRKPPMSLNTFGAQASGPVYVPKVFDGRNRLFWLLSYEGMRQRSADPSVATFPLMEWRQGDFTSLYNAQGQQVQIYDPLTTNRDGIRQPFAGNRIPAARISPIATEVFKYYPAPRTPGEGPAHINNFPYPSLWIADMDQWIGRMDFVINSRNTFFFRYGQNPFSEYRGIVFGLDNVAEPTGNAPLVRNGRNWTMDWTSTLTPRMTFNLRAGLNRWEETTGSIIGAGFDQRKLGFDPALVSQFTKMQFPNINLGAYQYVGTNRLLNFSADDSYTVQPNAALVVGKHFLKFGAEGRRYNDNRPNPGMASGSYTFNKNWTRRSSAVADAVSGDEVASFLLGYPGSAYVDQNIDPAYTHNYWALFLNDDWKVSSRLTLNIGLRWDYESPNIERRDRMVRTLDFNAASPIAAQVKGLNLKGAVLFAGRDGQPRGAFEPDRNNFQPRIGASYRIGAKWVLRGGYGLYYLGQNEQGSAMGFSQRTNAIVTLDNLTPAVTTANAFALLPGGKMIAPVGASNGAASFLGEGLTVNWVQRPLPYSHQYSFDIQRELPGNMVVEAGYVGNITSKLPMNFALNYVPVNELNRRTAAGAIDVAYYTARVENPMAGLIPNNAALNGSTVTRPVLWYAFPQYNGVTVANVPIGRQRYHGMQSKVSKRFSHGLTFLASYTINKVLEQANVLNAQDFTLANWESTRLEKRSAGQIDAPQKFTLAGVYELPFGKGKPLASNVSGLLNQIIGGWQLNWDVSYMSGWTLDYPNAAQVTTGSAKIDNGNIGRWFNTSLWDNPATGKRVAAQEPYTLRTFPTRFSDVRLPGPQNWDASLSKYFPFTEQLRLQFRFEMVNMMNHPWYADIASVDVTNAAFGQLNPTQRNLPRFIKLALNLGW